MKTRTLYLLLVFQTIQLISHSQESLPQGISESWYSQQTAQIDALSFSFKSSKHKNDFTATNHRNNMDLFVSESGFRVSSEKKSPWSVSFLIKHINHQSFDKKQFIAERTNASTVRYTSTLSAVEYQHGSKGLRQNFIIQEKSAASTKLEVEMQVQTDLLVQLVNAQALVFSSRGTKQQERLRYDQLKVWDSRGVALAASMHYDSQSGMLTIAADDSNAVYPVTIDPLNHTPEWTTSADGVLPGLLTNLQLQSQAGYGYTVAGLGDVNGDGFDDVAIGAPTMADVVTGSGNLLSVGAVFLYFGSANGLPATPSKILQPTSPVAGSLFGLSIAAGDITGDGKNDIIIGAPQETYQTSAATLLGSTNVNVKAGKVYVYRSEDLFSAAVPSPSFQIKLSGSSWFSTGVAGLLLNNTNVGFLFGYSIAATSDMNGDGKQDIVVGSPAWLGTSLTSVQTGAAFVYYSSDLQTSSPVRLPAPTPALLGLASLPLANTAGLMFGFSVDGTGDYNGDGYPDIAVGAPAGINLGSLGGIFTGQFLGGTVRVFNGNGSGVQTSSNILLQASPSGLLSSAANLFGYSLKAVRTAAGASNGNILVGAPNENVLSNVGGLQLKAGTVNVFKARTGAGTFTPDQSIGSPRAGSVLGLLSGQTLNVSMMFGASIDNMLDVNCDNIGDIIVGEPLSTNVPMIGANVTGGAAYILLGKADGTYDSSPYWDLGVTVSPLLGVNASSLLGYSVAGAGYTKGKSNGVRSVIGGPANALDFGSGLLNMGNTLSTLMSFTFDNNGLGKAYSFAYSCNGPLSVLPVKLINFYATNDKGMARLNWMAESDNTLQAYTIERSEDGLHFSDVAMVLPAFDRVNSYVYPDKFSIKTVVYYRLRMSDKDGTTTYSAIAKLHTSSNSTATIAATPNPATDRVRITMAGMPAGNYMLQLRNAAGQYLRQATVNFTGQSQTTEFSGARLSAGLYWVELFDRNGSRLTTSAVLVQ
ncbi:MAG: FG-GAP repeat protein [Bacteroidota bacterium]|nr:FG-GAP repeat protein [Bacteroidota bacterium]